MLIDTTSESQIKTEKITITIGSSTSTHINIKANEGYQYLGNTCGYIMNDIDIRNSNNLTQGQLKIYEVSKDLECEIIFGAKTFEVLLETDGNSFNNNNLNKIYIFPQKSWYSDNKAQNQISKIKSTKMTHLHLLRVVIVMLVKIIQEHISGTFGDVKNKLHQHFYLSIISNS